MDGYIKPVVLRLGCAASLATPLDRIFNQDDDNEDIIYGARFTSSPDNRAANSLKTLIRYLLVIFYYTVKYTRPLVSHTLFT